MGQAHRAHVGIDRRPKAVIAPAKGLGPCVELDMALNPHDGFPARLCRLLLAPTLR